MDETFEIVYTWGLVNSDEGDPTSWFVKVQALDTEMYAVAHYDLEDTGRKFYECTNDELLVHLIQNTAVYEKCRDQKNAYVKDLLAIREGSPRDFM